VSRFDASLDAFVRLHDVRVPRVPFGCSSSARSCSPCDDHDRTMLAHLDARAVPLALASRRSRSIRLAHLRDARAAPPCDHLSATAFVSARAPCGARDRARTLHLRALALIRLRPPCGTRLRKSSLPRCEVRSASMPASALMSVFVLAHLAAIEPTHVHAHLATARLSSSPPITFRCSKIRPHSCSSRDAHVRVSCALIFRCSRTLHARARLSCLTPAFPPAHLSMLESARLRAHLSGDHLRFHARSSFDARARSTLTFEPSFLSADHQPRIMRGHLAVLAHVPRTCSPRSVHVRARVHDPPFDISCMRGTRLCSPICTAPGRLNALRRSRPRSPRSAAAFRQPRTAARRFGVHETCASFNAHIRVRRWVPTSVIVFRRSRRARLLGARARDSPFDVSRSRPRSAPAVVRSLSAVALMLASRRS